jgi:hypothetical protein
MKPQKLLLIKKNVCFPFKILFKKNDLNQTKLPKTPFDKKKMFFPFFFEKINAIQRKLH